MNGVVLFFALVPRVIIRSLTKRYTYTVRSYVISRGNIHTMWPETVKGNVFPVLNYALRHEDIGGVDV
jgi:hypothetical protein